MQERRIGIFGGSGFYELLDQVKETKVDTPYGPPSDKIAIGTYQGKPVAFLPRHGRNHDIPPHKINFRANIWAMKSLGVHYIISPTAAGSLQKHIKPGHFVVCDQYVDRTNNRTNTFYEGPLTTHVFMADPYCPVLRELAIKSIKAESVPCNETGTVVVIQGPHFSTKSESRWYTKMGWEVINMTQYPEVVLAREQEMCFVNIALITDYDCGLTDGDGIEQVSAQDIMNTFKGNIENIKKVIFKMIEGLDNNKDCSCHHVLEYSRFND